MLYDVVRVESKYEYFPDNAVEEVIEKVNKICNKGHKGKKGWRPQGGLATTVVRGKLYVTQAIVNYEDEQKNKDNHIDVEIL